MSRTWKSLPVVLSLALLAVQVAIPWSVKNYISQDGPSHLYTAVALKNLVLHPGGLYASVYRLQPRLVSNWGVALLMNALVAVVGVTYAERCLSSLCMLVGFVCLTYFRRSVDPRGPVCDPLTNFLLNTWFIWIGFYNFYLAMAICPLLLGFYIRHGVVFNRKRAAALAIGLVLLFFIHALPAMIAIMALVSIGAWVHIGVPLMFREPQPLPAILRRASGPLIPLFAALAPTLLLFAFFVRRSIGRTPFEPEIQWALNVFPMHVFASARGRGGEEMLLYPAMLFYMAIGFFAMKRHEWRTVRPALTIAAGVSFCGYLLVPNTGFGSGEIKIRLAWAVFLFGCTLAASIARTRFLQLPLSIYMTIFLLVNLIITAQNVRGVSNAAEAYASALQPIPEGATLVRMRYGTQAANQRFGFKDLAMEPLFHADSWMAVRRHAIDLTDYQALDRLFPVCYRKTISGEQQNWLYEQEDGESHGITPLAKVLETFPVHVDYVVLVGDEGSEAVRRSDFAQVLAWLGSNTRLVSSDPQNSFVRVYQRSVNAAVK